MMNRIQSCLSSSWKLMITKPLKVAQQFLVTPVANDWAVNRPITQSSATWELRDCLDEVKAIPRQTRPQDVNPIAKLAPQMAISGPTGKMYCPLSLICTVSYSAWLLILSWKKIAPTFFLAGPACTKELDFRVTHVNPMKTGGIDKCDNRVHGSIHLVFDLLQHIILFGSLPW